MKNTSNPNLPGYNHFNNDDLEGHWETWKSDELNAEFVADTYHVVDGRTDDKGDDQIEAVKKVREGMNDPDYFNHVVDTAEAEVREGRARIDSPDYKNYVEDADHDESKVGRINEFLRETLKVSEPTSIEKPIDRSIPELTGDQIEKFHRVVGLIEEEARKRGDYRDADARELHERPQSTIADQEDRFWNGYAQTSYKKMGKNGPYDVPVPGSAGKKAALSERLADLFNENPRFRDLYLERISQETVSMDDVDARHAAEAHLRTRTAMAQAASAEANDPGNIARANQPNTFNSNDGRYTSFWNKLPGTVKVNLRNPLNPEDERRPRTIKTGLGPLSETGASRKKRDRHDEDLARYLQGNGVRDPYGAPVPLNPDGTPDMQKARYAKTLPEKGSHYWYQGLNARDIHAGMHAAQAGEDRRVAERNLMKASITGETLVDLLESTDRVAAERAMIAKLPTPNALQAKVDLSINQALNDVMDSDVISKESDYAMFITLNEIADYVDQLDVKIKLTNPDRQIGLLHALHDNRNRLTHAYNRSRFMRESMRINTDTKQDGTSEELYLGQYGSTRLHDGGIQVQPTGKIYYEDGSVLDPSLNPRRRRYADGTVVPRPTAA